MQLSLQPIPYQGSKRSLAPRICAHFPSNIDILYEPFAGSAAISIYAAKYDLANSFVIGDAFVEIIDLWDLIINNPEFLSKKYNLVWLEQFDVGINHFNIVRARYNSNRDPVDLLYLIARCVKNAVRFNQKGDFSQSVDKRRTGMRPEKLARTVHSVSHLLKGRTRLFKGDFNLCIQSATVKDLVYLDPPYQGTSYGADKRYASQIKRETLISSLYYLNERSVPYILSYDGKTGNRSYGEELPPCIKARHIYLEAGLSSQSTLNGLKEETVESLYISNELQVTHPAVFTPASPQKQLFFQSIFN